MRYQLDHDYHIHSALFGCSHYPAQLDAAKASFARAIDCSELTEDDKLHIGV